MSTMIVLGFVFAILALLFFGMNASQAEEKVKAKQAKDESAGAPPVWLAGGTDTVAAESSTASAHPRITLDSGGIH